jgi:2-methylcitrate dehydratase
MDRIIEAFATFAAQARLADFPDRIQALASQRLADAVACAVGGYGEPSVASVLEVAPWSDEPRPGLSSRVLGQAAYTTPEMAALCNTTMIRVLDYNDRYPHLHTSDTIGAMLAHALEDGVDGERLVASIVVAFEIGGRIADKMATGWDQGYAAGFGAVAGVGNLLGLDRDTIAEALSIIATGNLPLRATRSGVLSAWKGIATAYSTSNAVLATRLARAGVSGPASPLEGRQGLFEVVTGPFSYDDPLPAPSTYRIERSSLKYWPVEYHGQAAAWAGVALREQAKLEELATIEIGAYEQAWFDIASERSRWDPRSRESADHSMPYIFVTALKTGGVGLGDFEAERYLDPELRDEMDKISVHVDEECDALIPDHVQLKIHAVTHDGRAIDLVVTDPRGFWRNPMTETDVFDKLARVSPGHYDEDAVAAIFEFWNSAAGQADLNLGFDLLAARQTH